MKIIDSHLHLAKVIAGYCRRGELRAAGKGLAQWGNGDTFQLLPEGYGDTNFTVEKALEIMDQHGVEKAVLMQGSMYGFQNQYHAEIIEKYPDRFCPSCTIDPFMTQHLETLEYFFSEKKFRLAKFEISSGGGLMGCHDTFKLDDERMMKIYELINKYGATLTLDVGDSSMGSHQPEALARIAEAYPKMKIVICHLLAPSPGEEDALIKKLELLDKENIWFDIAALPKIYTKEAYPFADVTGLLRKVVDKIGSKKILWGTDAPFAAVTDSYVHLLDYLQKADFTANELEDIYYNNANTVYFT